MTIWSRSSWSNGVVPIAVKGIGRQADLRHLCVADSNLARVPLGVQFAPDLQARRSPRIGDQVHDCGVSQQRPASPVLADEREQAMFDLVPLARSRRQVTDVDRQAR